MNVTCPSCTAHYLLPAALLGREGARVRCPACGQRFRVSPEGEVSLDLSPPPAAAAAPTEQDRAVAREVLAALDTRLSGALAGALERGEVFQRHGLALIEAFDEYRRRVGSHAGGEAFRAELKARWGLDLFPVL